MNYLLAHDLGTSGNKATLFSLDGKLIKSKTTAYGAHYFNETWVEQDANDWWKAVCSSTKGLIAEAGINAEQIKAISFSGQMMGCLCLDKNGNPLRPSIIWADQRAEKQSAELAEKISQYDFYHMVGHRNTPSYGVQKLMWIKENEPEIYEQTYKAVNSKDYIVYKLTGKICTDPSDANSFACFDINKTAWSQQLVEYAGIDGDKLPEIVPSTKLVGGVTKEAAALTGLAEGTPVVMGAGDGVAANIGCGSVDVGRTYCCLGTSAWVTTTTDRPLFDEQMRTVTWAHVIPGFFAPNGTMQYAGGSYAWMKEQICNYESLVAKQNGGSAYDLIDQCISQSSAGANGIVFLPYLLGERAPRWNPDARGAFLGLKAENDRADLLRSVPEGITANLAIILDILRTMIEVKELTVVGGGAQSKSWQHIMADMFGAKILVPALLEEGNSMGAAVIAGVGAGLYKDLKEIEKFIEIRNVIEPDPAVTAAYAPLREKFDVYYNALAAVK